MSVKASLVERYLTASVLCSISFSAQAETFEEIKEMAKSTALSVANDVNATMLTSESNGEDIFSVSDRNGSSWSTPVTLDSRDNVGSDSSLAIDSSDNLHVTYQDNTNGNLEYMMASNNTPSSVLITASNTEEDVITISVKTVIGRIHRLWVSDDLENWSIWGTTDGTGGTSNFSFDKTSTAALSIFGTSELPNCFFMAELIPEP